MNQLSCRQVEQIVQSFLDGELPADQAHRVSDHLDRCEDCGVEAATIDRVRNALAGLRPSTDRDAVARLRRGLDGVVG